MAFDINLPTVLFFQNLRFFLPRRWAKELLLVILSRPFYHNDSVHLEVSTFHHDSRRETFVVRSALLLVLLVLVLVVCQSWCDFSPFPVIIASMKSKQAAVDKLKFVGRLVEARVNSFKGSVSDCRYVLQIPRNYTTKLMSTSLEFDSVWVKLLLASSIYQVISNSIVVLLINQIIGLKKMRIGWKRANKTSTECVASRKTMELNNISVRSSLCKGRHLMVLRFILECRLEVLRIFANQRMDGSQHELGIRSNRCRGNDRNRRCTSIFPP